MHSTALVVRGQARVETAMRFINYINSYIKAGDLSKPSLRADVSYFLCFTREAKEIGDVCTQAIASPTGLLKVDPQSKVTIHQLVLEHNVAVNH